MQQNSGRSEVICILTILLKFRGLGIDILHSTDYLYARNTVRVVQGWSATEWCNCTNRDLWESIAFLLDEYQSAGTSFKVFHNKAHPENWKNEITLTEKQARRTPLLLELKRQKTQVARC